jgi:hypothetical protein
VIATDIKNIEDFHEVMDCQYACPLNTAVSEHIRLTVAGLIP